MATAFVGKLASGGKPPANNVSFVATVYYAGADVDATLEGAPQELTFLVATGFTLADLKAAIITTVQAHGTRMGWTVAAADVDLISVESGP